MKDVRDQLTPAADTLILVMVGLPARGKSFIAKKIHKFLVWRGYKAQVFNVGQFRRQTCSGHQDHSFFDPSNQKALQERERLAEVAMDEMLEVFFAKEMGKVAIFDATNTTKSRRKLLLDRCQRFSLECGISTSVVFIESICNSKTVLRANMLQKVTTSPDYVDMDVEVAISDLAQRISNYEAVYEALEDEEDVSYIKLFDLQSKVHANRIYGRVAKSLLPFMMSIHIGNRPIWLVRAGHCTEARSDLNSVDKIPCVVTRSAPLSESGISFAKRLAAFVEEKTDVQNIKGTLSGLHNPVLVMTSTLPRAVETAQFINEDSIQYATLNPLDKGECYGLSMDEMKEKMPAAYEAYEKNPLYCRFPGGECYFDLMKRLEGILVDMEQHTGPVLLVSHISTLQVLYCYFLGVPIENCPDLSIPFHSVLQLVPNQDGWDNVIIDLKEE